MHVESDGISYVLLHLHGALQTGQRFQSWNVPHPQDAARGLQRAPLTCPLVSVESLTGVYTVRQRTISKLNSTRDGGGVQ